VTTDRIGSRDGEITILTTLVTTLKELVFENDLGFRERRGQEISKPTTH